MFVVKDLKTGLYYSKYNPYWVELNQATPFPKEIYIKSSFYHHKWEGNVGTPPKWTKEQSQLIIIPIKVLITLANSPNDEYSYIVKENAI